MSCTAGPRPPSARGGPDWRVRLRSPPATAVWGCDGSDWQRKRRRHPSAERASRSSLPGPPALSELFNAPRLRNANDALARRGDDGVLVIARAHAAVGEDAVVGDPFEGLLVDLLGVGLEHETLARTPAARVHHGVVTRGELVLEVVGVAIGAQVDVALRALERAEELAQVFGIGIAGHHGRDHERRVDHFAEAKLFGEVVGAAEQRRGLRLAIDELIEAMEQHAVGVGQIDLVGRHIRLERLDGRIVAARLIADGDWNAGEILRFSDWRILGHEDARRRHRIDAGIKPAIALRRGDADGPMAGAAHVGAAAALERLHGADLVALVMVRAVGRFDQLLKDVVEAFVLEISLLLGHPFLQPKVRLDDELVLAHVYLLLTLFLASELNSAAGAVFLTLVAVLRDASRANHLHVLVHQLARAGAIAHFNQ